MPVLCLFFASFWYRRLWLSVPDAVVRWPLEARNGKFLDWEASWHRHPVARQARHHIQLAERDLRQISFHSVSSSLPRLTMRRHASRRYLRQRLICLNYFTSFPALSLHPIVGILRPSARISLCVHSFILGYPERPLSRDTSIPRCRTRPCALTLDHPVREYL
jgi:hypothetical protein